MSRATKLRTYALRGSIVTAALLVAVVVAVRWLYGGGEPYGDVTTEPLVPTGEVEALVELDLPPGNLTRSTEGRIFFNTHPFVAADRFADAYLFELVDGEPQPYPDSATQKDLRFTFGMDVDAQGRLWVISPATLDRDRTRLQAFDLDTDERVFDHEFDEGVARFAQDLRVLSDGRHAILADTGAFRFTEPSILVADLDTREVRTVLVEHASLRPQDWFIQTDDGAHTIGWGLITFAVGVDGIALSPDEEWLYFATMNHDTLYRIPTEAVLDASLSSAARAQRIERVGTKPLSDGIATSAFGEILLTDVEHGAIVGVTPGGALRTLVRLEEVVWADGVEVGPEGSVIFTDSAIPSYLDPLLRPPDRATLEEHAPYRIYRFQLPPADGA